MKNIILVFFMGCTLLLSLSCSKEEPKDIEYVRCLFNGERWEDCCDCPNPWGGENGQHINCIYRPGSESIYLGAANDCNGRLLYRGISIRSDSALNGNGRLTLRGHEATNTRAKCNFFFELDTLLPNFLVIESYDANKRIVEGRFEFTAIDPCGDTVEIKEGTFRAPFRLP